jgi:hypothetical protein
MHTKIATRIPSQDFLGFRRRVPPHRIDQLLPLLFFLGGGRSLAGRREARAGRFADLGLEEGLPQFEGKRTFCEKVVEVPCG